MTVYDHAEYINTLNTAAYLVELECSCLRIVTGHNVPEIGDDIYNTGSYSQICNQHGGKSIKRVFRIFPVIPTEIKPETPVYRLRPGD